MRRPPGDIDRTTYCVGNAMCAVKSKEQAHDKGDSRLMATVYALLQLLAYHAALSRGTDVDKPRNLAKSVTVE